MEQKKFLEINKTNSYGEKGTALVRVNDIVGIKQIHVGVLKTYDENGNVISETPKPREYIVFLQNEFGKPLTEYHLDQEQYESLVDVLTEIEM